MYTERASASDHAEAAIIESLPDRPNLAVHVWHNTQGWYVSAGKYGGRLHLVTSRHTTIEAAINAAVAKLRAE